MMPKRLALVDVRDVHLDHRPLKRRQGVENRHGRMRVGPGIDHNRLGNPARGLNPVDQLPLVIALKTGYLQPQIVRQRGTARLDIR